MIEGAVLEQLAQAIHQRYLTKQLGKGVQMGATAAMHPWSELDENLREANRAQARDIAAKLSSIGATVIDAGAGATTDFTDSEVEELAEDEHARWYSERTATGWVHGVPRDDALRIHPSLVGWDELPESEKVKDRDAVRNIPAVLAEVGLAIGRN